MKLYKWIHTTWTNDCEISLFSTGFFALYFRDTKDYQGVFECGPWFWGRPGLLITPNVMSMTRIPVWIRLLDLPLHLWSIQTLEEIGNKIEK